MLCCAAGSLKNLVACDVLWSDPVNDPGIRANEARGCGTVFGPDVTAEFLASNGLQLIIRSHEGPDARDRRLEGDKMPSVDSGYAEDHVTDSEYTDRPGAGRYLVALIECRCVRAQCQQFATVPCEASQSRPAMH